MKKTGIFVFIFCLLFLNIVSAGQLRVSQEHPFYVNNSWIEAKELGVGDYLQTIEGKKARITSIEQVVQQVEVYNLEDDIFHNYAADDIIVHNSNSKIALLLPDSKNNLMQADILMEPTNWVAPPRLEPKTQTIYLANNVNDPLSLARIASNVIGDSGQPYMRGFKGLYYNDGKTKIGVLWTGKPGEPHHADVMIYLLRKMGKLPMTSEGLKAKYSSSVSVWDGVSQEFGAYFTGWEFQHAIGFKGMPANLRYTFEMSSFITNRQKDLQIPLKKQFVLEAMEWAKSRKIKSDGCPAFNTGDDIDFYRNTLNLNIVD